MNRRRFLQSTLGASLATAASAALPKMKITRVRYFINPASRPIFNQSSNVVMIDTDAGITGVGEGGTRDMIEQCASMIIGEDPSRIEHLWQMMYRGFFYPAGREKIHALGALDMALWDIKGKALGVPLHQLLGGLTREYVECYSTGFPSKGSVRETAKACVEHGFRAFRTGVIDGSAGKAPFRHMGAVRATHAHCKEIREGVGPEGDWCIDYHTRLDFADAVRLSKLLEEVEPFFCEDLVRSENKDVYRTLRGQVKVPIAVGEQFSDKWDINDLIEDHLIDYNRITIPNSGGITDFMKQAAICETHYVGLTPHFTGPIAEAALVHCCGVFAGPAVMEMTGDGSAKHDHLPQAYDIKGGKMIPNDRPGLGVTVDLKPLTAAGVFTEQRRPIPMFRRPDGSITNW